MVLAESGVDFHSTALRFIIFDKWKDHIYQKRLLPIKNRNKIKKKKRGYPRYPYEQMVMTG